MQGVQRTTSVPGSHRTVDAPTRVFHWLLALSFMGAYLSRGNDAQRWLHAMLGYTMGALLVFRVLWGVAGPRHARRFNPWRRLKAMPTWLQGLHAGTPSARLAQNLGMALTMVMLLALTAPLVLSGHAVDAAWGGEWLETVHELLGELMVMAVLAHMGQVVALSVLRRRNLVAPMLTGRAEGLGPDLVRCNHPRVAGMVLVAVLAFWGWQWVAATPAPLADSDPALQHHRGEKSLHDHPHDHDDT